MLQDLLVRKKADKKDGRGFYLINAGSARSKDLPSCEPSEVARMSGCERKDADVKEHEKHVKECEGSCRSGKEGKEADEQAKEVGKTTWTEKSRAEMYEFVCKSSELRDVWMKVFSTAISRSLSSNQVVPRGECLMLLLDGRLFLTKWLLLLLLCVISGP